jgi:hypothetical protein
MKVIEKPEKGFDTHVNAQGTDNSMKVAAILKKNTAYERNRNVRLVHK